MPTNENRIEKLQKGAKYLSEDLKGLLANEIKENEKNKKKRSSDIISIFAAHNYYANGLTPEELRATLEDLGPTYVKIGQIMSSRVDILPESFCKELAKLRTEVKQLDPKVARAVIEQETGKKIEDIYSEFRDEPLGSASIGQAHYGVLKDGTKVVTKVQRPLIADMMFEDFKLLKKLAGVANVIIDNDDSQTLDLMSTIEEFEKVTYEELDFRVEAENTRFFKENCIEDETKISCPTVIDELCTERIFTMTFVDGCSISKKEKIAEQGYDINEIGHSLIDNYVHQILDVGVFHADPHQGNIMISEGIPYWIDFGMIGRITEKDIDLIQDLVVSVLKGDGATLVKCVSSMGATGANTDMDKLSAEADELLSKYANVTGVDGLDMTTLFDEITTMASDNNIELPGRFTMLIRSVITIEGVIEEFCPELNLLELISTKLMNRMKKSFDLKSTVVKVGKELLEVGGKSVKLPALIADSLSLLNRGKLKVNMEVNGLDEPLDRIGEFLRYTLLAVFACVLFIGSCILCMTNLEPKVVGGVPLIALAGILFSIALAIFSIRKLWKKK